MSGIESLQSKITALTVSASKIGNKDEGTNYDSGNLFGASKLTQENVDNTEASFLKAECDKIKQDGAKLEKEGVKLDKNFFGALESADDLAQMKNDGKANNLAGKLAKGAQKALSNSKSFSEVKYTDGDPGKLKGKLNSDQTKEYLTEGEGKKALAELGAKDVKFENGKATATINGKECTIEVSQDGKLRAQYKMDKNDNESIRTVDLQLKDKNVPKAKNEKTDTETLKEYHVNNGDINLENEINKDIKNDKDKVQISKFTPSILTDVIHDPDGKIKEGLENISGKSYGDLQKHGNHAYYTDDKGVEHQFHYDENGKQWIETEVTSDKNGGYNVKVNMPKAGGASKPDTADNDSKAKTDERYEYKYSGNDINLNDQLDKTDAFKNQKISNDDMSSMMKDDKSAAKLKAAGFNPTDSNVHVDGNKAYIQNSDGTEKQAYFTDKGNVVVVNVDHKNHKATIENAKEKSQEPKNSNVDTSRQKGTVDKDGNYKSTFKDSKGKEHTLELNNDQKKAMDAISDVAQHQAHSVLDKDKPSLYSKENRAVLSDEEMSKLSKCKTQKEFYSALREMNISVPDVATASSSNKELGKLLDSLPKE